MAGKVKIITAQGGVVPAEVLEQWAKTTQQRPAFMPTAFQNKVLLCNAQEIFVQGQKGSGKSAMARAFMCKGNPDLPWYDRQNKPILTNMSYLYHPKFLGMVIRRNMDDLRDWMRQFSAMVRPVYGGKMTEDPWLYTSAYGAQVVGGHMADASSWQRYTGQEIHRLVWEEIVFQPDIEAYNFIKSVVRSAIPEIRAQIMANCNALGPGVSWLWPYFIEVLNEHGDVIERPEGVPYVINNLDERTGIYYPSTRCWFFGKLSDNPFQDTPAYRAALLNQPAYIRDAYYWGVANRRGGSFFENFRKKPNIDNNEPANAQHVYPREVLLKSLRKWMPVAASIDWGFGHQTAILVGQVHTEENRLYIIDGFADKNMATEEVGMRVARMLQPYLSSQQQIVRIALSPDAFSRESEIDSEARRIWKGICKVLGPDKAWLQGDTPDTAEPPEEVGIALVRAFDKRAMGWSLCYELLNFVSHVPEGYKFSHEEAQKIYMVKGTEECDKYYKRWRNSLPQILPRCLIANEVQGLIEAIPKAMRDAKNPNDIVKTHWEGADWVDAWRYLVMNVRMQLGDEPAQQKQIRELAEAQDRGADYQELLWLNRYQEGQRPPDAQKMLDLLNNPDLYGDVSIQLQ